MTQVSVVIPVFNAVAFLEQAVLSAVCLASVGEVILIDDGSSDDSLEKCWELSDNFPKVNVYTHPGNQNKGAAVSRNLGISKASFPFVAFLDADDVYYPNRFGEDLKLLTGDQELKAVYANVEMIEHFSGKQKIIGMSKKPESVSILTYLLRGGYFHTNSITVRKSFFEEVGNFNQDCWPHEDSEMWIRMAAKGKLTPISDMAPLASYVIHGNNLSSVASNHSKRRMWETVYHSVFYSSIGLLNKGLILKQLCKYSIRTLLPIQ